MILFSVVMECRAGTGLAAVDDPVAVVSEATLSMPLASAHRFGGGMAAS